jgi:predicted O-methyltransferase YrrM
MSLVKKVVRVALRVPRRHWTRRELTRLAADERDGQRWLWSALLAVLNDELDVEERKWVERIEDLRRTLSGSRTVVSRVDYGARNPRMHLTDEMMYQGETTTATVGDICRTASNPSRNALLLFKLIRNFRPAVCLELGTSLGITAAYEAAALTQNGAGRLVTLEGAETIASLASQNFAGLGLTNVTIVVGRFQDTLDGVLRDHRPIDYAFVDGHHDERATVQYFQQILPALAPRAVLVFDDIAWNDGMSRAWKAISEHPSVALAVDLAAMGICVIDPASARRPAVQWPVL